MVYDNLMLDIETMGNQSYSSILSIGALEFDIETGNTGNPFYMTIDLQSCLDLGLIVNAGTITWWMQQNEEARRELTQTDRVDIVEALERFAEFCDENYYIWGNSARFDCGILQNAYDKLGMNIPWDFRKERCLRTLVAFDPLIKAGMKREGTAHNALDDCRFQIKYTCKTWDKLNS